ncbi:hypothetical protein IU449_23750 [Nocardia higoensis]|uniref:Uncharacterized protein n=1 Tax=Nocardia higoensis TaxID=228599 RepID=A0ABS0DGG5_9NOCA|nr:hypothetical protein [Nocardia higoensis]MBF6357526.1 hypothetical protein [Nocardia higoensis]
MRRDRVIAIVEAVVAAVLMVAAVASWRGGVVDTSFAAQGEVPAHDSVRYVGPWLVLAATLVAVAGLTLVDATARVRRTRSLRP